MITNVLMAKTIEFRVTRGTSSRIFHLGTASPLVFGLEEFLIGDDGKLIAKVRFLDKLYSSFAATKMVKNLNFQRYHRRRSNCLNILKHVN